LMEENALRKASISLPGRPKKIKKHKEEEEDEVFEIIVTLPHKETKLLKNKKVIDFSHSKYRLEDVGFLRTCTEVKELDLSMNNLSNFSAQNFNLVKLKHLALDDNMINSCRVKGLKNLVSLSLRNNRLRGLDDMTDLLKLVYLDLSGNNLTRFVELSKLKALRVLDLSENKIDMKLGEFKSVILVHLKTLAKLNYLSFFGNPIAKSIPHFLNYLIYEISSLKCYDWESIKRDDRNETKRLVEEKIWDQILEQEKTPRRNVILEQTRNQKMLSSRSDSMALLFNNIENELMGIDDQDDPKKLDEQLLNLSRSLPVSTQDSYQSEESSYNVSSEDNKSEYEGDTSNNDSFAFISDIVQEIQDLSYDKTLNTKPSLSSMTVNESPRKKSVGNTNSNQTKEKKLLRRGTLC